MNILNRIKIIVWSIRNHFKNRRLAIRKDNFTNAYQTMRGIIPFHYLTEPFLDIMGRGTLTYKQIAVSDIRLQAFMDVMYEMAQYVDADLRATRVDGMLRMPRFLEAAGFTSFMDIGVLLRLPVHKKGDAKRYITVQYTIPKNKGRNAATLKYIGESESVEFWQNAAYAIDPIPLDTLLHYASVVNRNITIFDKVAKKRIEAKRGHSKKKSKFNHNRMKKSPVHVVEHRKHANG